jgi:hypothetical protein
VRDRGRRDVAEPLGRVGGDDAEREQLLVRGGDALRVDDRVAARGERVVVVGLEEDARGGGVLLLARGEYSAATAAVRTIAATTIIQWRRRIRQKASNAVSATRPAPPDDGSSNSREVIGEGRS